MKHIKITQGAYLDGYDGAFYQFNDEEGDALSIGLWDYWYKARAEDEDGEEYTVIWKITNQEAYENGDEAYKRGYNFGKAGVENERLQH